RAFADPDARRCRRPDAQVHPPPAGRRTGARGRPRAAVPHVAAGGVQAPGLPRARALDREAPRRPPERLHAHAGAAEGGRRLGGGLPPVLGGDVPAPRRSARGAAGERAATKTPQTTGNPMKNAGALKITTPSDLEIAMTRVFQAPRRLVFQA